MDDLEKLDEFFNKVDSYNDEMIAEEFKIQESKVRRLLNGMHDTRSELISCVVLRKTDNVI